ncbi:LuxR C-terminal-related transcriptional regulator [Paraburkholderia sp. RL18-085-BIA-A]
MQTIKAHRARVMTKMEVTSLAQPVHIIDRMDIFSSADRRLSWQRCQTA